MVPPGLLGECAVQRHRGVLQGRMVDGERRDLAEGGPDPAGQYGPGRSEIGPPLHGVPSSLLIRVVLGPDPVTPGLRDCQIPADDIGGPQPEPHQLMRIVEVEDPQ